MENKEMEQPKIEKVLNRNNFNVFDSGIACIAFIVMQIMFDLIYGSFSEGFRKTFIVGFLASLLVEVIFFFAVIVTSTMRKVHFL